jgi:glycosyltransferase involved in cell wall biosynthesis
MKIVIIGDAFPPMNTSGAVMLRDLAAEFVNQGDSVTVIVPSSRLGNPIHEIIQDGIHIISVRAFETKDISYTRRMIAEFLNPFLMWARLKDHSSFLQYPVDLVIWYSPSIFWGPLVKKIKYRTKSRSYLILRDIFPDWAVDLGLIKDKNLALRVLRWAASYQYQQADTIGVQSPNNLKYLSANNKLLKVKLEVLWNWVGNVSSQETCVIRLSETHLSGKKLFIYAGNIGVAQGVNTFLKVVQAFAHHADIGFVFVGRGSEIMELKKRIGNSKKDKVIFFPEIPNDQINDLYAQCDAGIIVLDGRHKTHNIPGKFASYMRSGLPVFGIVNARNDMIGLVDSYNLGYLGSSSEPNILLAAANNFAKDLLTDKNIQKRCVDFGNKYFDVRQAVQQIKSTAK